MSEYQLHQGDCLEILSTLEAGSVDAVITDPPYSSGARQTNQLRARGSMLRGEKWENEWFGTDNLSSVGFIFFMRGLALSLFDKCKYGAHLYIFIDWRNYPLLYQVIESAGWRVNNLLVWNKEIFGMGDNYRNQHELVILASKGTPGKCYRHDIPNVIDSKRVKQTNHPTEKPVDLIELFLQVSTQPNDIVLDPFMGSGTTGVACAQLGRRFLGCEISPEYFTIAQKRIAAAYAQTLMPLFAPQEQPSDVEQARNG